MYLSENAEGSVEEVWLVDGVYHTAEHGKDSVSAEQGDVLGNPEWLYPGMGGGRRGVTASI